MATYDDREHFIPLSKAALVDLLCREPELESADGEKFREFCRILESLFHFEYHEKQERLKQTYEPFNPDADTVQVVEYTDAERKERLVELVEAFGDACEGANFTKMSDEELATAFEGWSPFGGINLKLDLNHYVEYSLYYRGESMDQREARFYTDLLKLRWPRKRPVEVKVYKRLAILAKVKDLGRQTRQYDTQHVFIKLFKDVPALDLEMLFPTTRPALKTIDMLNIVLPILLGLFTLVYRTVDGYFSGVPLTDHEALASETTMPDAALEQEVRNGSLRVRRTRERIEPSDEAAIALAVAAIQEVRAASQAKEGHLSVYRDYLVSHGTVAGEAASAEQFAALPAGEIEARALAALGMYEVRVAHDLRKSFVRGVVAGSIVGFLLLLGTWTMRSVFKYFQSKQRYIGVLAQSLFYLNLDNNAGVFAALIDMAEEEECKEAFFAAFFLNLYPAGNPQTGKPWTEEELDDFIEAWIERHVRVPAPAADSEPDTLAKPQEVGVRVDFEVDDALAKLERLGLLSRSEADGTIAMLPWDQALARLDEIWDNYFTYHNHNVESAAFAAPALPASP